MKFFWRCPLVCVVALASYVMVHVFAGVLHHHGPDRLPPRAPTADLKSLGFQPAAVTQSENEDSCLLCSVLHLAQIPAIVLSVAVLTTLNGEAFAATANIRPHPLETATYSRGPPLL